MIEMVSGKELAQSYIWTGAEYKTIILDYVMAKILIKCIFACK